MDKAVERGKSEKVKRWIKPWKGKYSAIMNVEYQELINVTLWQKGSK